MFCRIVILLSFLALVFSASAQQTDDSVPAIAARAAAAYDAGQWDEASALYARVLQALPRSVSGRLQLARALARGGRRDEALQQLGEVVALGARVDETDAAWTALKGDPRFTELVSLMKARTAPLVRGETAFLLEKDLIPESIAFDPKTNTFFAGSMYKAKIVRIAADGTTTDFVSSRRDGLTSVLGMKIDPERRELWAVAGNFIDRPPMEVDDPSTRGQGAVYRFDLDSGRLIRRYARPGGSPEAPTWMNDLVIAPNGDVYGTGMQGVWIIRRDAETIGTYFTLPGAFFNGITMTPDGKTLFVASHTDGIVRVDVATKEHRLLPLPDGVTLGGIDGLYFHDRSLIGVQNGIDPWRVVRAWLDPDLRRVIRFDVLEQAHPLSDIPLTGTIVGRDLYYIARSQLRAFDGMKIWPEERLKETVILRLPIDLPGPPPVDREREIASLREMHAREIRSHVERDAAWIGATTAEQFVSATSGRIDRTTRDAVQSFFEGYFEGATYPVYEDLEPPVIRVSDDGSMAWILSRTRVRRVRDGTERAFVYAGIMTYEKRDGSWVRVSNASTFE